MSTTRTPVRTTIDGTAQLGLTKADMMGIRFHSDPAAPPSGQPNPAQPAPAVPVTPVPAAPAAPAAPAVPAEPAAPAATAWDGKIESLDPGVQKIITDLRQEAGNHRVAAKTEKDRVTAILKAAGIEPDAPDPVAIAQKATETATAAVRKLSVFEQAALAGADPSKLLNRNDFTTSIAGIDPSDGPAIKAAIDAAVTADPSLKTTRAVGASTVETPGGTGEQGPITEAQLAQMTPEQISDALDKGQLKHLL